MPGQSYVRAKKPENELPGAGEDIATKEYGTNRRAVPPLEAPAGCSIDGLVGTIPSRRGASSETRRPGCLAIKGENDRPDSETAGVLNQIDFADSHDGGGRVHPRK
jgi:hypothetical protein